MSTVWRFLVAVLAISSIGVVSARAQTGAAFSTPQATGDRFEAWLGYGLNRPNNGWSDFGFAGFTAAINQINLLSTGPIVRGEASGGFYTQSFNFQDAALLFGYRWALGPGFFSILGGPEIANFSAPTNQGFFIAGPYGAGKAEIEYQIPGPVGGLDFYSVGSYSSLADTFSAYVRPGWRATENLRFGPEGGYTHTRFYEEARAGGFIAYWLPNYGTFWLGGGAELPISQETLVNRVSDGYYGYVSWSISR